MWVLRSTPTTPAFPNLALRLQQQKKKLIKKTPRLHLICRVSKNPFHEILPELPKLDCNLLSVDSSLNPCLSRNGPYIYSCMQCVKKLASLPGLNSRIGSCSELCALWRLRLGFLTRKDLGIAKIQEELRCQAK